MSVPESFARRICLMTGFPFTVEKNSTAGDCDIKLGASSADIQQSARISVK